jgi:malonyl-CoA/methylmalonyl-CoA synthetase
LSVFFEAVAAQSEAHSGKNLLVPADGPAVTHGAALLRSAQMARALRGLGLTRGDRVAAMVEKSSDAVLLYLACLQAGFVYVPINPGFRREETAHVLTDATPAMVVCMPGQEAWFDSIVAGMRAVALPGLAEAQGDAAIGGGGASGDPAVILYTSGTTGRPKGAVLSQANILANGLALSAFWRFSRDDVLLHVVPLFHSHGLFVSLSCTLLSGSALLLTRQFAVDQAVALLPACSVFMGVPTMYSRMVAHPGLNPAACRNVRLFACGSAPLSVADYNRFTERGGQEIVERYGMSETAINTSNPLDGKRKVGSVGVPLPGVEVRVEGDAVQVRGAHVFGGYWNQPEQSAAVLRPDGWFDTGDLGRIDGDGYLSLVGRAKDLIISGGYNVYPIEVERVLQEIPGVADVAVIGLPHRDYGEAVTAILVPAPDASLREAAVIAAVKERLAAYKAPKRIVLTDTLPRNAIGKVQKNVLQQRHAGLYDAQGG